MYGTVETVRTETGVTADMLDLDSEIALIEWIEARLAEATDFINFDRNRDYEAEVAAGERVAVPPGINAIAVGAVANLIGLVRQRRENPIIRVEEFEVARPGDAIWTPALRTELRRYPAKPKFRFTTMNKASKQALDDALEEA